MNIINSDIQKFKSKKVIVNTDKRIEDYISGVFTRSKKCGSARLIWTLKNFKNNLYATDIPRWSKYQMY